MGCQQRAHLPGRAALIAPWPPPAASPARWQSHAATAPPPTPAAPAAGQPRRCCCLRVLRRRHCPRRHRCCWWAAGRLAAGCHLQRNMAAQQREKGGSNLCRQRAKAACGKRSERSERGAAPPIPSHSPPTCQAYQEVAAPGLEAQHPLLIQDGLDCECLDLPASSGGTAAARHRCHRRGRRRRRCTPGGSCHAAPLLTEV